MHSTAQHALSFKIIEGKNKVQDFVQAYHAVDKKWATPQAAPMLALLNLRPIYISFYLFIYIRESISGGAYFPALAWTLFSKLACAPQKSGIYFGRISRNASIHGASEVAHFLSDPSYRWTLSTNYSERLNNHV
jgi:hypothetical protein